MRDPLFALPEPLCRTLEGFGGPLASWFLYNPARVLLDAGEGVAIRLVQRVAVPETVLLTHAHYDHISGLTGFLLARVLTRSDPYKPVTICYPGEDEATFQRLQAAVSGILRHAPFAIHWRALVPGERMPARNLIVEPFATYHDVPSQGYRFLEKRKRLKPQFRGCAPEEIKGLRARQVQVQEEYEHVALAFTGDTGPGLDAEMFKHADVLIHEATFVVTKHRLDPRHASVEEVLAFAVEAQVKNLVLYHISPRYKRDEILHAVREFRDRTGFSGGLTVVAVYTHEGGFYS
jgi:ribonuclease Z